MADWNYTADLDLAKDGLSRISEPDKAKARNLVKALLSLIQNSTLELESGSITDSFSKKRGFDESQDEYQKPLDWNYAADFIQRLIGKMPMLTRKRQEQIQHLMSTCLTLAEESEEDPIDMLNSSPAEDLKITESQVISHPRPFEIPEVFQNILSYFPLDTLLTCRLINQYWNQMSIPWIQEKKKKSVVLNSEYFPKFWTVFENTAILPVTILNFWFQDLSLDQVTKFLTKHGSFIRTLILTIDFPRGSQGDQMLVMKTLQLVLRHVPNLRSLCLFVQRGTWEVFPDLSIIQEEVNVILPRVETLKLIFDISLSEEFLDGFFTMIPNVGIIQVGGTGRGQDWKQVVTSMRSLKLKNVTMTSWACSNIGNNNLLEVLEGEREFLRSQSENLEVLSLAVFGLNRSYVRILLPLPVLKNLKRVTLRYLDYKERDGNLVVPLQPEQLPKLKHLGVTPEIITSGLFAGSLFPSVQEIKFIDNFKVIDNHHSGDYPTVLPQIVAQFPNLRKVTNIVIHADISDMERIFTNLGNIEDLEIKIVDGDKSMKNVNKNFSLALSGFPGQAEPKCVLTQLADRVGYESLPLWIDPPRPSLRDLTNLKRLVLSFDSKTTDLSARFHIDEIAVYMTFLRMSPELRLILQGDFLISDKLAGKLTAHYRNIYFMPSD